VASVAACAAPGAPPVEPPSTSAGPSLTVVPERASDEVTVTGDIETAVIEVRSATGIGAANATSTGDSLPAEIVVRLHLDGLEMFALGFGDTRIELSVPSNAAVPVLESVAVEGAMAPITASDPRWMRVERAADGAGGGTFDVAAPPALFASGQTSFSLEWIDFYR